MLLTIPKVLTDTQVAQCRGFLDQATWVDGRVSAGSQSARVKNNSQLPDNHPEARRLGGAILSALERNPRFFSAALPLKVFTPTFNRFVKGESYGLHVDSAIRQHPDSSQSVRADLSATLFLSDPSEYEGGELVIEGTFGSHCVKLPAGDLVLYPSSSLHEVRPVIAGTRFACVLWIQSMIRDAEKLGHLLALDDAIRSISRDYPDHRAVINLTRVYHNLLRSWAEC